MRIVFLRSNPVNPDPRVEKEVNTLIGLGHKASILAWNRTVNKDEDLKNGELHLQNGSVPIRYFNIKATFGGGIKNIFSLILFLICQIVWLIKHRKNYDVIHACDFDTVIPAYICAKLFRKKYVYDIFDYYVEAYHVPSFLKNTVEKLDICMINNSNAVIIANENRLQQIAKSTPENLYIVHNSPDVKFNLSVEPDVIIKPSNRLKFVYVGILGKGRMLEEIIDMFGHHPEWELHIGGFGELESYVIDRAHENANIFFYGKIPYAKTLKLESECDVLFAVYDPSVPNHRYSSPNKLYEALMLGKPIIVAEGTGIDELVKQNDIGKVVKYNKFSFEQACEQIEREFAKKEEIARKARILYENEYSWGIMEKRLGDLYDTL
ncbi:glycosyltransferase family 4 protein [Bacillus sp. S72]|uniref:glycosyltransferase family 4 protein n=1 Tax=unclassified Bacillus (in: firmicutes) TaxID=185979 RepID=UPI00190A2E1C|nr:MULTISPECIES: glycosyltransferase family 4 protein [unclassified Bacillus (in: firmicutes)]MBJ9983225.1 glycosyltransferase family 4 protein [Bacillus sp. S29]MBK0107449.1 glycosyltransferase family 4 protein [Bacillus sp. S73]MBK0136359.1 glycosyltransferase family 4 protein [Bacillus sp. S72]MBK0148908.1 glycosyltransferase family 4 protein [Bacillus sp. S74]MBK0159409.1 glycosyltransferase family 4 protein [Bacillus sp. S71]